MNMDYQFEYINETYGMNVFKGKKGKYNGKPFKVVGASNYIKVKFESGGQTNIHPKDVNIEWD